MLQWLVAHVNRAEFRVLSAAQEAPMYHTQILACCALLLLTAALLLLAVRRRRFVRSMAGVPGPRALPVLGNALLLTGGQDDFFRLLRRCTVEYGECFVLWVGMRPFVFLQSAEAVQPILNSTVHIDKSYEYGFLSAWVGTGLLTSTGTKWHSRRRLLTPSFHSRVLADFCGPARRGARIFAERLALAASRSNGAFDVVPLAKRCTLDLICETAMGHRSNMQLEDDCEYAKAIEEIASILQRRFITPWLKPEMLFQASSLGRRQRQCLTTIHSFTDRVIQERREELQQRAKANGNEDISSGVYSKGSLMVLQLREACGAHVCTVLGRPRLALLDLLLELQAPEHGAARLSDQDIREEVNTFLFAGHDTLANSISWCLYCLGRNPESQSRAAAECRAALQASGGEEEEIGRLPYLEACIREALRLYPAAPIIARDLHHPLNIGCHTLPAGVTVLLNLYLLHRDPRYFPDPEGFHPERFLHPTEQPGGSNPFAYIPFSAGSRNCIGQRFALLQLRLVLAEVLARLEVRADTPPEQLNLMGEIVLVNKEGVRLTVTPRPLEQLCSPENAAMLQGEGQ